MQLIVLGMHRSGTSALAGLLKLMGAYFAPPELFTGANQENPKGFFERRDIRVLNDSLLEALGCDWDRLGNFSVDALLAADLDPLKLRAREIVAELDQHGAWCAKEPRFCLLLPFWRQVLERPMFLHIVRNPIEVAMSLKTRNGFPFQYGIALWELYTRTAFRSSRGQPRILVQHADLMREPRAELVRIQEWLRGHGEQGLSVPSDQEIGQFVDPGLHREHAPRDREERYLNGEQLALHRRLLEGLPAEEEELGPLSESAAETLSAFDTLQQQSCEMKVELRNGRQTLSRTQKELRQSLEARERTQKDHEQAVQALQLELQASQKALAEARAESARTLSELELTRNQLDERQREAVERIGRLLGFSEGLLKSLREELASILNSPAWKLGNTLTLNFAQLRSQTRLQMLRTYETELTELRLASRQAQNERP